jgi:hypothetical protein
MGTKLTDAPWETRADELRATEGPYCVFVAWQEWAEAQGGWLSETIGELSILDQIACFELCELAIASVIGDVGRLRRFVEDQACDCHDEYNKLRPDLCERCQLLGRSIQ